MRYVTVAVVTAFVCFGIASVAAVANSADTSARVLKPGAVVDMLPLDLRCQYRRDPRIAAPTFSFTCGRRSTPPGVSRTVVIIERGRITVSQANPPDVYIAVRKP